MKEQVTKAKWSFRELNRRIENLKKAVLTPMIFIGPSLTIGVLNEIQELKSHLPKDSKLMEESLRGNRDLIVKIQYDLAELRSSFDTENGE